MSEQQYLNQSEWFNEDHIIGNVPFERHTVPELRAHLEANGLSGLSKLRKHALTALALVLRYGTEEQLRSHVLKLDVCWIEPLWNTEPTEEEEEEEEEPDLPAFSPFDAITEKGSHAFNPRTGKESRTVGTWVEVCDRTVEIVGVVWNGETFRYTVRNQGGYLSQVTHSHIGSRVRRPAPLRKHRLDHDTDRCVCGGMWVYFESTLGSVLFEEQPGVYGCEAQGHADAAKHNEGRDTNDRLIEEV